MRSAQKQSGKRIRKAQVAAQRGARSEPAESSSLDSPVHIDADDKNRTQADRRPLALLLDLSGNKQAATAWVEKRMPDFRLKQLNKASLKWESKREALARLRALSPDTFAILASDLSYQSARGLMILFGIFAGARRVVLADLGGRIITRTRLGALVIEAPRLALELVAGYIIIVPLSWLITFALRAGLGFRKIVRASQNQQRKRKNRQGGKLRALYIRARPVPAFESAGGMATHIRGFSRGAFSLGHELHFVASSRVGIPDGADAKLIGPSTVFSATRTLFELWNNIVFTIRALRHAASKVDVDEIDFIYQRYSRFSWAGTALSLLTGLPLALEFNGSEVWVARHWDPVGQIGLLKQFERLDEQAADSIFVVSEVERRNLIAAGVAPERVIVNMNGVDPDEFWPDSGGRDIRCALGVEDRIVIGFVGTFGPWHGATVLAEAAQRLKESRCHFIFVGDGDERSLTETIIARAGVGATFTGRIAHEKVVGYLDACDILVSPQVQAADGSEFFGSPTKLFEYMAMSKAIIASRLGQVAHVIDDGKNGLLVSPGNPEELAQAINRLAEDDLLRARLGAAARQKVIEQYTWRHNAARVFDTLTRIGAGDSSLFL